MWVVERYLKYLLMLAKLLLVSALFPQKMGQRAKQFQ